MALHGYIDIDVSFIKSVSHGHSRRSQSSDVKYLETPFCKQLPISPPSLIAVLNYGTSYVN